MRHTALACGAFLTFGAFAQSTWPRVVIGTLLSRAAVRASLDGSAQRLQDPECSRILSGMRGATGQSLGATLAERAPGWTEYLRRVYFSEGSAGSLCERQHVLAFTAVNSRVVFICSNAFVSLRRRSIWHAEAVIIHEVLHTLGLPDGNDKDQDITEQVLRACHR